MNRDLGDRGGSKLGPRREGGYYKEESKEKNKGFLGHSG